MSHFDLLPLIKNIVNKAKIYDAVNEINKINYDAALIPEDNISEFTNIKSDTDYDNLIIY